MSNARLIKVINTPAPDVLKALANSREVNLGGVKVQALSLGAGGFGNAYLYKSGEEYRVAKVFYSNDDIGYGNIERRITSFNSIYTRLYDGQLASLATARPFNASATILDMPYIGGDSYFDFLENVDVHVQKVQALLSYFMQYEFFVSDYYSSGNIVCFFDPKSSKKYILVRDVDLVGRKDSYLQGREKSVTYSILKEDLCSDEGIEKSEFIEVLRTPEEVKTDAPSFLSEFAEIKKLLLEKLTSKNSKYDALSQTKNFSELCFIAAQKRKKHWFSSEEGFTGALDELFSLISEDKYPRLKNHYKLYKGFTRYDLQEIGFYGNLRLQDENVTLREKNLKYIYSIKHNNEESKSHIAFLRNYSLFAADFKTLPIQQSVLSTQVVLKKSK